MICGMPDLFLELRDERGEGEASPEPLTDAEAVAFLATAGFSGMRLIPWGSNYSFAVALEDEDGRAQMAIYKPESGEAPLYDFPSGTLHRRETAAYVLDALLGWGLVPPTVIRDGPHGVGSVQLYVEPEAGDPDADPRLAWGGSSVELERLVLFDHLANNADRKLSHCLRDIRGKIWGIDHGLTFNVEPKLKTVLWQFVECPVRPELIDDLIALRINEAVLRDVMDALLEPAEVTALLARVDRFIDTGRYPRLNPHRNIPYGWW